MIKSIKIDVTKLWRENSIKKITKLGPSTRRCNGPTKPKSKLYLINGCYDNRLQNQRATPSTTHEFPFPGIPILHYECLFLFFFKGPSTL